jgi:hypothetical protein
MADADESALMLGWRPVPMPVIKGFEALRDEVEVAAGRLSEIMRWWAETWLP